LFDLKKGIKRRANVKGATCNITLEYMVKGLATGISDERRWVVVCAPSQIPQMISKVSSPAARVSKRGVDRGFRVEPL
jgi:hypothetical protein